MPTLHTFLSPFLPDQQQIKNPRRFALGLLVIFFLALGVRLITTELFVGINSPIDVGAQPDQVDYELLAHHLRTGQGYSLIPGTPSAHRAPGTSLTLLPVYAVFGRSVPAARVWFAVLSALTCLVTAWLACQIAGPLAGWVAGLWLALYPGHFYFSLHLLSEVPCALFLSLALALSYKALRTSQLHPTGHTYLWLSILAGALWGLTALTRSQLSLVAPIGLGLAILWELKQVRQGASKPPRVLWTALVHCFAFTLVLTPWIARNHMALGKATLSTSGGYSFWGAHNETILADKKLWGSWVPTSTLVDEDHPFTGNEVERNATAWRYGRAFVSEHRAFMPVLTLHKYARVLIPQALPNNPTASWAFGVSWLITLPFLIYGAIVCCRRQPLALGLLLAPMLSTLVAVGMVFGNPRFREANAPAFVTLAAIGLATLWQARTSRHAASSRHND